MATETLKMCHSTWPLSSPEAHASIGQYASLVTPTDPPLGDGLGLRALFQGAPVGAIPTSQYQMRSNLTEPFHGTGPKPTRQERACRGGGFLVDTSQQILRPTELTSTEVLSPIQQVYATPAPFQSLIPNDGNRDPWQTDDSPSLFSDILQDVLSEPASSSSMPNLSRSESCLELPPALGLFATAGRLSDSSFRSAVGPMPPSDSNAASYMDRVMAEALHAPFPAMQSHVFSGFGGEPYRCTGIPLPNLGQDVAFQDTDLTSTMTAPQQRPEFLEYRRAVTQIHTDRLGELLGLSPPYAQTSRQSLVGYSSDDREPTMSEESISFSKSLILNTDGGIDEGTLNSLADSRADHVRLLTEMVWSRRTAFFFLNRQDQILSVADSASVCKDIVASDGLLKEEEEDAELLTMQESLRTLRIAFSELLSGYQSVAWWQNACREVLLRQDQQMRPSHHGQGSGKYRRKDRCFKELVLRWQGEGTHPQLVEVTVAAVLRHGTSDDSCLFVTVRRCRVTTVASLPLPRPANPYTASNPGRLGKNSCVNCGRIRLLVSRHGLILRATSSAELGGIFHGPSRRSDASQASVVHSVLGPFTPMPAVGQSLVDTPSLTPLLPVVAQAAILELAQVVQLTTPSRRIAAMIQPEIASIPDPRPGSGRPRQPSGKVWVTLSSPERALLTSDDGQPPMPFGLPARCKRYEGPSRLSPDGTKSFMQHRRASATPFCGASSLSTSIASLLPPRSVQADRRYSSDSGVGHRVQSTAATLSSARIGYAVVDASKEAHQLPSASYVGLQTTAQDDLSSMLEQLEQDNDRLRQQISLHPRSGLLRS